MGKPVERSTIAVVSVLILYALSSVLHVDALSNLLSVICDLSAAGIIFFSVFHAGLSEFRVHFILIGLGVLSWTAADLLWLVYRLFLLGNPGNSQLITGLYFATNLFLLAAIIDYCVYRFQKWDTVQLILDASFISTGILWLLWVLFFDKKTEALGLLVNDSIVNTASIATDFHLH